MLAFCDGQPKHILRTKPEIDRARSKQIAQSLFPSRELEPMRERDLSDLHPWRTKYLLVVMQD
jgi:hypothetical protein